MAVDFRLIDYNYMFQNQTVLTASSTNSNFPVSNLKKYFRSKTWRSSGNFEITSSNNKINFKEFVPELTATLTIGTYTATSLATEIKTQLEAVGARTYTVSFNTTTGKWSIVVSGSFSVDFLFGSGSSGNSVGATIGFTGDVTGSSTYTSPNPAIHTSEWVQIDLVTTEEIDTFAMIFDQTIGNRFSGSAVVKLQASATPVWTSPPVDITLSFDEDLDIATHFFTTDQSYRYWRVKIVDPANNNGFVEIHKMILGKKISLSNMPQVGFGFSYEDLSRKEETNFGQEYVDVFPIRAKLNFDLILIPETEQDKLWNSFKTNGSVVPVFVVLDALSEVSDKDRFSIYGKYEKTYTTKHRIRNLFDQTITIIEAF